MINCTPTIAKLKSLYDFCYDLRDNEIDTETIKKWHTIAIDAFLRISKYDAELNYMKTIIGDFTECDNSLHLLDTKDIDNKTIAEKDILVVTLKGQFTLINETFDKLNFNLIFFEQLNFFDNNIVAVGANGSGKTSLANNLRTNLNNNGLVISAQRVLFIPEFENIPNPQLAEARWLELNKKPRTFKNIDDFLEIKEEFGYALSNLIAKHNKHANNYLKKSQTQKLYKDPISQPSNSELQSALELWNNIFDYRRLFLGEDGKITVCIEDVTKDKNSTYQAIRLSEGEKAAFYIICQVIQAPSKGFIIIDEPEMYLHKTIISKLWDSLEALRDDCIFIYLTHDLDFASGRTNAKKVWIKSFEYPATWDIEAIPENSIPEALMLELLGSRKNILFCEGTKGSIDETIYKILFPKLTIIPVESCSNVINFTKAYNRIPIVHTKAFGLIDSDFHDSERLDSLVKDGIFNFQMAEVENLFLVEDYLREMADYLHKEYSKVKDFKKQVLAKLEKEKELQCARYVSCRINDYFKDSDITTGKTSESVKNNFENFKEKIEIDKWFNERLIFLNNIIKHNNYDQAIKIYNNKGLKGLADECFKINFIEFSIKHLAKDIKSQEIIKGVFSHKFLQLID